MPVTLRARDLPRAVEGQLRDAADPALAGDWCITLSRSLVDGELSLQLESRRSPTVLAAIDGTDVIDLESLLQRLSAAASLGSTTYRR